MLIHQKLINDAKFPHIFRLALFMSFWGMLILIPVYSTEPADTEWGRYTLSNVAHSEGNSKGRLWLAAIFSYIFSAYFCQLLHAEYNNFSVRRLQYLVQVSAILALCSRFNLLAHSLYFSPIRPLQLVQRSALSC